MTSIHFYLYQQTDSKDINASSHIQSQGDTNEQQLDYIPFFTLTDDQEPTGRYWPPSSKPLFDANSKAINTALADIEEKTYEDITQSTKLFEDRKSNYIGYFIDTVTQNKIYLYATESNTVHEETDNSDPNDDHADVENQS
jgi:hypothetical protein